MDRVILKNKEAQAIIALKGAEMISYTNQNGKERIWEGNPLVWSGHGPVLFPIIGSLFDNKTYIQNILYHIPKHGISREALFSVTSQGENYVELCFSSSEETKKDYPFDFSLYVRHTIDLYGFTTVYRVVNYSDKAMPACVGGHPAFVCPMEEGYNFEDYSLVFPEKETGENLLVNSQGLLSGHEILQEIASNQKLKLKYEYFDEKDTLLLSDLRSRSVKLINEKTGNGLQLEFPRFPVLAVWTKPQAHASYICLEPWMGLPDTDQGTGHMEEKAYIANIDPQGGELKLWYTMTEIEGVSV